MLDYVRNHQKILQIILLVLILPSFVFIGVQSYTKMGSKDSDVAKVGKDIVSINELDNAVKNQAQRTGLSQELANSPAFKGNVLNQIIQQKLLRNELQHLKLQVSDQRLAKELNQFPEIQALKKPDGTIDTEKYRQLLQNNGLSIAQFQNIKRSELMGSDLQNAVAPNQQIIQSSKVANQLINAYSMEREVQVLFVLADRYTKQVTLTDTDLKDYFQAHPGEFQTTPSANIEYLILSRNNQEEKEFSKKADTFANLVYEQPDSLAPAAQELKLTIMKESDLTSLGKKSLPKNHPLNEQKTLSTIFKDEILKSNKNSEAFQLSNGDLIAVHVTEYHPSQTKAFDDVKGEIEKIVRLKKAEELALKNGNTMMEELMKDPTTKVSGNEFTKSFWVSRLKPLDLKGEPFEKVFNANTTKLPVVVSAKIPGAGLAIYRINQVRKPQDVSSTAQVELTKQIAELTIQNELSAYFDNIRSNFPVKILKSF
jgi:peptidyl-prolyl cis-trans isomerase D